MPLSILFFLVPLIAAAQEAPKGQNAPQSQQTPVASEPALGQESAKGQENAKGKMAASIRKQRESALRQVRTLTGAEEPADKAFFQIPWNPEPLGPPIEVPQLASPVAGAACDPAPMEQLNPLIEAASRKEGVNSDLIRSVIQQESAFRPCAVSAKGAQGLMQLMPATQQELGVADPFDPAENINGGVRYLKQMLEKFNGRLDLALAAYNAGPGRVERDGEVPAIPETQDYVAAIRSRLPAAPPPPKSE